jgi:hypothetical protein
MPHLPQQRRDRRRRVRQHGRRPADHALDAQRRQRAPRAAHIYSRLPARPGRQAGLRGLQRDHLQGRGLRRLGRAVRQHVGQQAGRERGRVPERPRQCGAGDGGRDGEDLRDVYDDEGDTGDVVGGGDLEMTK